MITARIEHCAFSQTRTNGCSCLIGLKRGVAAAVLLERGPYLLHGLRLRSQMGGLQF